MNWLKIIWSRLRLLGQRRAVKSEIDEELQFHIEQRTAENIAAGMSPEEAERAARKRFGNIQSLREECRKVRRANFGETVLQDIRFGFRMLRKNLGFTLTAVLTIGLAIGATTVIYSFLHAIVIRSLPYDSPDRIVCIGNYDKKNPAKFPGGISPADLADWQAQNHVFTALAFGAQNVLNFSGGHDARQVSVTRVSAPFFDVFNAKPIYGRTFLSEEDTPDRGDAVVASYGFWKRELGAQPEAIGKPILLDGRKFTLVGVMPAQFNYPNQSELWIPTAYKMGTASRIDCVWFGLGRLIPGTTLAQAQNEMNVIAERLEKQFSASNANRGVLIVGLHDLLVGDIRPVLLVLFSAVMLVLLIACANMANLLLARAVVRQREMVVRAALGAARSRIVRQLLTESTMLGLLGGAFGIGLAYWGIHLVRSFTPWHLPMMDDVKLNPAVLAFSFGVSVFTGVLFGIFPALHSYAKDLTESLKGRGASAAGKSRARNLLVISEVALSTLLLISAALLVKSLFLLRSVDPGYKPDQIMAVQLHPSIYYRDANAKALMTAFYENVRNHVAERAGESAVCFSRFLPMGVGNYGYWFALQGKEPEIPGHYPNSSMNMVGTNYFQLMGIPLLRGRVFNEQDAFEAPPVAVVNQAFVRKWLPDEDPLGKQMKLETQGNKIFTIVGVVGDIRFRSLATPPQPQIYVHYVQTRMFGSAGEGCLLVRTGSSLAQVETWLRDAIARTDATAGIGHVTTLASVMEQSAATPRFQTFLFSSLAALALVLTTVGIYGVLAYTVRQRTQEIGVRMALGAQRSDVLWLVLRHGMKLALIGVACGIAAAFALTRVMASLLFDVKPTDLFAFAGVPLLLLLIALLACWLPARRAAKVEPMVALRYE